jgi:Ca-activated chloride channel homolog
MRIDAPFVLLFLFPLAPYAVFSARRIAKNGKSIAALASVASSEALSRRYGERAFHEALFFGLFYACGILSLSGISWGERAVPEVSSDCEVALCLDVSRSMLAADTPPSRLVRAVEFARSAMGECEGASFSLTVFKGDAFALFPMTEDVDAIDSFLDSAGPALATAKGSDQGKGIEVALSTFSAAPRKRILVLLTDGEFSPSFSGSAGGQISGAAEAAKEMGARIFAIGFGTEEGGTIPVPAGELMDAEGAAVRTRLAPERLMSLVRGGEGAYFRADDPAAMRALGSEATAKPGDGSKPRLARERIDRGSFFLALAGIFLALRFLSGLRIFKPEGAA